MFFSFTTKERNYEEERMAAVVDVFFFSGAAMTAPESVLPSPPTMERGQGEREREERDERSCEQEVLL